VLARIEARAAEDDSSAAAAHYRIIRQIDALADDCGTSDDQRS
jgi:hypothetical protein